MRLSMRTITVIAHPGSSRNVVKEDIRNDEQIYRVYTTKKAVDGLANTSIVDLLSSYFGVKKYHITLVSGEKSRKKVFAIQGL